MPPPGLKSPREVTLYYDSVYDSLIASGKYVPFLHPWAGLGGLLVIGYLLVDHRHNAIWQGLRYPVFALMCSFQTWVLVTNRAKHPAPAFGIGLGSAWGMLWISTIMAVNDCQTDFRRINRSLLTEKLVRDNMVMTDNKAKGASPHARSATSSREKDSAEAALPSGYVWQSFPETFSERLDWVLDAFCNFRGVGWNWQTSTVPSVSNELSGTAEGSTGIRRFTDRRALVYQVGRSLIIGFMLLGIFKLIIDHDPYFWGYVDAAPPSWLPNFVSNFPLLSRSYRLLVSLYGLHFALWEICKLGPLFFVGILGPRWIGTRGEAWMNPPDMFGSFRCVLDHGLGGWWAGWWHQMFRVAFNAHSTWLLRQLGVDRRSEKGKAIALFTAFFLSGCLHASASYTQLGETRPILGPMRFFMLQPCAILLQMGISGQLKKLGVTERVPKSFRQITNFVFVHLWFFFTGPLLFDDFAKGGVWLLFHGPTAIR